LKAVILAGGLGSRLSEETTVRPKPMVEIGGKPILWHIMKHYAAHGINDFIICCGYKGYFIKEYFANYYLHTCDVTIQLAENSLQVHQSRAEPWSVTLVDTGDQTQTGGRIRRVRSYLEDGDFCLTYGDGLSNVNIRDLLEFHQGAGGAVTMTAVQPAARFGAVHVDGDTVLRFEEKPQAGGWINGGFFVVSRGVVDRIEGDDTLWEREPLEGLAAEGSLRAFRHDGFWHPMDTLRDKLYLEQLWASGDAPWKAWT
jgi:glucose-1-phosphate cytidylyltransferase